MSVVTRWLALKLVYVKCPRYSTVFFLVNILNGSPWFECENKFVGGAY